ncbi:MAG: zinc-ribbon domain-containing protein [Desulfobacterales bacterium]
MPKATDRYNLAVVNPGLAKEWHPSRNGDLNPRNVTPGSGRKIWWICSSGHEWQATVYSRNRGSKCPVCHRSSASDDNEMLIANTDLIKQWHLTKNSGLNLRNLPPGFRKKVWWICEEGHEWEATVTARMKGSRCPQCHKRDNQENSKKFEPSAQGPGARYGIQKSGVRQPSFAQSSAATGFRKNKRFMHKATVIIEDVNSGSLSYAQTKDFSNDGMLLESAVAIKPGTRVKIKFDTQPFKSAPKSYNSVVRWCKEVADENAVHNYGIGVKFI